MAMARRRRGEGADGVPPPEKVRTPAEAGGYAREICLRRLALRPHTRAELATALRRHGIDDAVAAEVLDRYDEVGLVDDDAFARAWVSTRHHGRGLSGRALAGELRRRGVADETVDEALTELDPETEEATARALVARKLRSIRPGDRPDATLRRLVGMLARKGYAPGQAFRVVKEVLAEQASEVELDLDLEVTAFLPGVDDPDERREFG